MNHIRLVECLTWYQLIFLTPQLESHYGEFFCGNALSYLNVAERKDDAKLSQPVRERLTKLQTAYESAAVDQHH